MSLIALPDRRLSMPSWLLLKPDRAWDVPRLESSRHRTRWWRHLLGGRSGFGWWDNGGCNCPGGGATTITVFGCNSVPYPGVTVSVYTSGGGTLLDSDTTDGSGQVALSWSGTAGWITVTGQSARFQAYGAAYGGGPTSITLTPASAYVCISQGGCLLPWKRALQASSGLGPNVTFIYAAGTSQYRAGGVAYTYPGCAACGCPSMAAFMDYVFETAGTPSVTISGTAFAGPAVCPDGRASGTPYRTYALAQPVAITCPPSFQGIATLVDVDDQPPLTGCFYCGNGPDIMTITE